MDRLRELFGVRATLALPTLVAILSFVTGVANISARSVTAGPLADLLPLWVEQTAGFTGTLTGFLLLASVYGLRRRLRIAWYTTVLLLPITALQGLLQGIADVPVVGPVPVSAPLVVLSLLSLPTVLLNYRLFDRQIQLSTAQQAAIGALVGAQVYITAGTYALREQFVNVDTLMDAFYYGVVTASTVGYGDITPAADSQSAKLFTLSVVLVGPSAFALAIGSVLGPAIQARLSKALGTMTDSQLELLEDHVLVLGYGDLTEPILDELGDATPYIVITDDPDTAARLKSRDIDVLTANPSDEEPLIRAGIERARAAVVATENDAEDALTILTARELNPELRIIAAATDRENENKLRRAGADEVISPAVIGGHMLVESALERRNVEQQADEIVEDK